jgi:hypothetical protein
MVAGRDMRAVISLRLLSRHDLNRHTPARRRLTPQINAININMRRHNTTPLKNRRSLKLTRTTYGLLRQLQGS